MIIGVDIGTSVTKASAVFYDGTVGKTYSQRSRLNRIGNDRVEQDLDEVVESVAAVVRQVVASVSDDVEAVAITGQGDGLWLRDAAGAATRPPISWMDARASGIVTDWSRDGRTDAVFRLTGSGLFPGSQAALLAWMLANEPEVLDRSVVAGYCDDAVVQALTGQVTTDASDASLPFLDVRSRDYVVEAIDLLGLTEVRRLLIEPSASTRLFALSERGSDLLGLPPGTPITGGPYDLQACGFGSGTTRVGEGTLVVGTTLSCQVLTSSADIPAASEPAGMWLCTPDPLMFLRVMPSMVGTASIDWLLGLFGREATDLDSILETSTMGANGVSALSFFSAAGERAPFVEPLARGEFAGMNLATSQADLVRALCEGLAFAARHCFDELGLMGEVAACGGGLGSPRWAQLFADVLGRDILLPDSAAVGARGAALVAWSALGRPIDDDAWRAQRRRLVPDPTAMAHYEIAYRDYRAGLTRARKTWEARSGSMLSGLSS